MGWAASLPRNWSREWPFSRFAGLPGPFALSFIPDSLIFEPSWIVPVLRFGRRDKLSTENNGLEVEVVPYPCSEGFERDADW
jgi:hypothetical protein